MLESKRDEKVRSNDYSYSVVTNGWWCYRLPDVRL